MDLITDANRRKEIAERERAATLGPLVKFRDSGHTVALMPAGRPGDVAKFDGCVNPDSDAEFFRGARADVPDLLHDVSEASAEVVAMARSLKNFLKFGSFGVYIKACP